MLSVPLTVEVKYTVPEIAPVNVQVNVRCCPAESMNPVAPYAGAGPSARLANPDPDWAKIVDDGTMLSAFAPPEFETVSVTQKVCPVSRGLGKALTTAERTAGPRIVVDVVAVARAGTPPQLDPDDEA